MGPDQSEYDDSYQTNTVIPTVPDVTRDRLPIEMVR